MSKRALPSGITLNEQDAATAKGMLLRGDRQHDVASWFGVNGGRIAEIASGHRFSWVQAASLMNLPPPGPYLCGREARAALEAIAAAKRAVSLAEELVRLYSKAA
jgi:hypothetical protein